MSASMSASATWTEQTSAQPACRRWELTATQAALRVCRDSGVPSVLSCNKAGECCTCINGMAECSVAEVLLSWRGRKGTLRISQWALASTTSSHVGTQTYACLSLCTPFGLVRCS